jgi:hypothetical protein
MMGRKKKIKIEWDASADDASTAALDLFIEITDEHGVEVAGKIFAAIPRLYDEIIKKHEENWDILARLDSMGPKPNKNELARQLVRENGKVKITPQEINAKRHQIGVLVQKRQKAMANGTWPTAAPRPVGFSQK